MQIETKKTYTLINNNSKDFSSFFTDFKKEHTNINTNNIIVNLLDFTDISNKEIEQFLAFDTIHKENNSSFVIITKNASIDVFPETFNIVPTLIEAEDLIEMEEMQRELGF